MLDTRQLEELAQRLAAVMPPALGPIRRELEENMRAVLKSQLPRLELVSRDEFEASQAMLAKTRAKLDQLEAQVRALEKQPVS